jgi:hypothetical protein
MNNSNFVFYILTAPLARYRLRDVLFSHTSHFTGRLIVEFKKCIFEVLYFILYYIFFFFIYLFVFFLPSIPSLALGLVPIVPNG